GRWVYDWIEQTIKPANGDYQDLAGGKSGNAASGPFMRERNNTLVKTPLFSLVRMRGAWSGQPIYDFEHCCSDGAGSASGSLQLASISGAGEGSYTAPPPKVGAGDLQHGVIVCASQGLASAYSVQIGAGPLQSAATVVTGIGFSSSYSVNIGKGN